MRRRRSVRKIGIIAVVAALGCAWASLGLTTEEEKKGEVAIVPRWKVGEHRRYERVKSRQKTLGDESVKAIGRGPIDLTVIEAGEKGFLVRWKIGPIKADDSEEAADPRTRAMSQLVEGMEIDLELDDAAAVTGIRNWIEVKAAASKIADLIFQPKANDEADKKAKAAARSSFDAIFANKATITQIFTKEPTSFFMPIGGVFPGVGTSLEYEDRLPNPLGGPPFPSRARFTLASYNRSTGRALVSWTQTLDPNASARILHETMQGVAKRTGKKLPAIDEFQPLSIEDRAQFVIDTRTGWVEQFTQSRTTKIRDSSQEDSLSMTRDLTLSK